MSVPEVFWPLLEPETVTKPPHSFSNQRPLQSLHTQQRPRTEVHEVQIWVRRRMHFLAPELREMMDAQLLSFVWHVRRYTVMLKDECLTIEVVHHLPMSWNQNIINVAVGDDFDALFNEKQSGLRNCVVELRLVPWQRAAFGDVRLFSFLQECFENP